MIKIFLADDHPVVVQGLSLIFEAQPDFKLLGAATTSDEVVKLINKGAPQAWDVLVLDLDLPPDGGWLVLEQFLERFPVKPVLIYTRKPEKNLAVRALKMGAAGYLSKERSTDELLAAIRVAHDGDYFETPAVAEFLRQQKNAQQGEPHERLTAREFAIFSRFSNGQAPGKIAEALGVQPGTISTYLQRIRGKLGVENNSEITEYAYRVGLRD